MTLIALGAVGSDGHVREELTGIRIRFQVKEHRRHLVLALVPVIFDPRVVIAVGDGTLADIETHQVEAFAQSLVETGNIHLCPLGQCQ